MNNIKSIRGGNSFAVIPVYDFLWNRNFKNTKCNSYIKSL